MQKEILLDNIEKLFYNHTFKEISMKDIADNLAIKKASLYYYFSSKEDLFGQLIDYSFGNYKEFLSELFSKKDFIFVDFISSFIFYPQNSKNLFSVINQNAYCENEVFKEKVEIMQREVFDIIYNFFCKEYAFSKERTFIFISLLEDLGRKKCIFSECPIDIQNIIKEIDLIFNS